MLEMSVARGGDKGGLSAEALITDRAGVVTSAPPHSSTGSNGMGIWRPIDVGPLSTVVVRVTRILNICGFADDKVDRSIRSVGIVFDSNSHLEISYWHQAPIDLISIADSCV